MTTTESQIEQDLIAKLEALKYVYRPDIRNRASLEANQEKTWYFANKLGIALDGTHRRKYKERLEPLRHKRVVFIFDECHRSQFGDNHKAIKDFFPNAQLFGFTGTPIFGDNASKVKIDGDQATDVTTEDVFQKQLHAYTITHAIEDKNVLQFHVDYSGGSFVQHTQSKHRQTSTACPLATRRKHHADPGAGSPTGSRFAGNRPK